MQGGEVTGGGGQVLAAYDVGGRGGGAEVVHAGQPHSISPLATFAPIWAAINMPLSG